MHDENHPTRDIPATLDVRNAELRVYHMWDESLVGVARNDRQNHALIFSTPAKSPPGAFGVKKYVIFNTREGMSKVENELKVGHRRTALKIK